MRGQKNGRDARSTMRKALETVLLRTDDRTVVEECRRCGTTLESTRADCPSCGCSDIAEYRIR